MDFLKAILGEELYKQVETAINAHNGNEANKDKLIKLANLATGEYVGKGKFDAEVEKLTAQLTGKQGELDAAKGLIEGLQKSAKGNEDLQGQLDQYQTTVAELQAKLAETEKKSALKVNLLAEKCNDIDYVTYKIMAQLAEQGKALELDENGNIKGWDELLSGIKTQLPTQFDKAKGQKYEPNPLPTAKTGGNMTRSEFLRKPYAERAAFANENPDAYKEIMNN